MGLLVYASALESERSKMQPCVRMIAVLFCVFLFCVFFSNFIFSINITPSQRCGTCGFQEIIHVERRKIGSVCICAERIYGDRSQK